MKHEYKRLVSNFFSLLTLQGINYLLPLITFPYLVRVLGIEKYGMVSFALAFVAYFNILVDYGFNLTATKDISLYRENKERLSRIFSSVFFIKGILLFVSFVILLLVVFLYDKFSSDVLLYLCSFGIVIGQMLFPQWFFQGIEKMEYITILNAVSKLFFTFSIFIFVLEEKDYYKVPLIQALGILFSGIVAFWVILRFYGIKLVWDWQMIRFYITYNFYFFLSRLAVNLYTVSNVFVLGLFFDAKTVGFYSIAERVVKIVQTFYSILTQTIYPYIVKSKNLNFFKKIFVTSNLLNILLIILLAISAKWIFWYLFHIDNEEVLHLFYLLCIVNFFILPTYLLGFPLLGSFGYEKYANMSAIYGAFMHMMLLAFLILTGTLDVYTIVFVTLSTEFFVLFYRFYYARKFNLIRIIDGKDS